MLENEDCKRQEESWKKKANNLACISEKSCFDLLRVREISSEKCGALDIHRVKLAWLPKQHIKMF